MTTSDQEKLQRFRQLLDFEYFILKPRNAELCAAHPDAAGAAFPVSKNLSLLNAWLSGECTCLVYGVSQIRYQMLVEKKEIWWEAETDPA